MTEELNELGLRVGQRRVGRLMRQNGIRIIRSRKFKRTTDSDHAFNIAPNLLQQDFSASAPNQKWAGDITYIWTREGWVYLAVIIDLFSRRVVGLGHQQPDEAGSGDQGAEHGRCPAPPATRLYSPHGSRRARRIQPVVATPDFGGADDDRQTEVGVIDAAQIVLARSAASLAA